MSEEFPGQYCIRNSQLKSYLDRYDVEEMSNGFINNMGIPAYETCEPEAKLSTA